MQVRVRVPATTANLGCGFDCVGMALALFNEVIANPDAEPEVIVSGEGEDSLARDETNLVYRTMAWYFQTIGQPMPRLALRMINRIPLTGGLGSSSAALVGGLLAANALAGGVLSREELLQLAFELEGHPDNVAPALLGGLVVTAIDNGHPVSVNVSMPPRLRTVIFVPNFTMSTEQARRLLPPAVPRADAIHNVCRAALLVAAMEDRRLDLLRIATQDRLHQPYRQSLFPEMYDLFDAALDAGALAACLSGAGSALLALTMEREEAVAQAFEERAAELGVVGRSMIVDVWREGAHVEVEQGAVPERI